MIQKVMIFEIFYWRHFLYCVWGHAGSVWFVLCFVFVIDLLVVLSVSGGLDPLHLK